MVPNSSTGPDFHFSAAEAIPGWIFDTSGNPCDQTTGSPPSLRMQAQNQFADARGSRYGTFKPIFFCYLQLLNRRHEEAGNAVTSHMSSAFRVFQRQERRLQTERIMISHLVS